jgi:MtN3 and saliva related transmembrane protein
MQMTQEAVEWVGLAAGTCTTISFLPQLIAVYKTKSAEDLSYSWLAIFSLGLILWLTYGILLLSAPVILANAVTLTLLVLIIALKMRYERGLHRPE